MCGKRRVRLGNPSAEVSFLLTEPQRPQKGKGILITDCPNQFFSLFIYVNKKTQTPRTGTWVHELFWDRWAFISPGWWLLALRGASRHWLRDTYALPGLLHCRTPQLGKRTCMEQVSLFPGIDQRALSMGGFLPWQKLGNKPQGATKPNQNQAKAGRTAPSPEVGAGVGEPLVWAGQSLSWPSVGLASSLWEVGSLCGIPKCYK